MTSSPDAPPRPRSDPASGAGSGRRVFVASLALATAIVLTAPFVSGTIILPLRERLPGEGFLILAGAVFALCGLGLAVWAARRLRGAGLPRFLWVVLGLALVVGQVVVSDRGTPAEAAVERFHFVLHGGLGLLFVRAWTARSARTGALAPPLAWLSVAVVGVIDEWVQSTTPVRTGELFDVLLNLYAGLAGVLVGIGLFGVSWRRPSAASVRALLRLMALGLLLLGGFVDEAHLGHLVRDPSLGSFRSYFAPDDLAEVNRERLARWTSEAPGPLRPLEVEDDFRTEAGWRVSARNLAWEEGDLRTAWFENRILEERYSAFLAIREGEGFLHRLPQPMIEAMREGAGDLAPPYRSAVKEERIWVRPSRGAWWTVVLVLAGLSLAVSWHGPAGRERR